MGFLGPESGDTQVTAIAALEWLGSNKFPPRDYTCNPSTWGLEAGGSEVQGYPQLQSGFRASLEYMSHRLKTTTKPKIDKRRQKLTKTNKTKKCSHSGFGQEIAKISTLRCFNLSRNFLELSSN